MANRKAVTCQVIWLPTDLVAMGDTGKSWGTVQLWGSFLGEYSGETSTFIVLAGMDLSLEGAH